MKITISKTLANRMKFVATQMTNEVQEVVLPKMDPKPHEPVLPGTFAYMKITEDGDEVTIYIPEDMVFEYIDAYLNVLKRVVKIGLVVYKSGLIEGLKEDTKMLVAALKRFINI